MNQPRCYDHQTSETLSRLCRTCQRIAVEHDIVTRVVDTFLAAGYKLREQNESCTDNRDDILSLLLDLDDAFMVVSKDGIKDDGWVRFVFGNDGYDVIWDYTTNLESILEPVNAYADTLAP